MNSQGGAETDVFPPEVTSPEHGSRVATASGNMEGDWLCAWCQNRVANERDRSKFDGKDQFTFSNPAGLRFEILTFAQTRGCRETGVPTLEHTWFPGYAWSFCHCDSCGQHLGWFYLGPNPFVGLITTRIVRALWVRN